MTRDQVLRILREHQQELRDRFGVKSLALFGSVVRGEQTDAVAIDLLVEFDDRPVGLFHLIGTEQHLADLLGVEKVDLVRRRAFLAQIQSLEHDPERLPLARAHDAFPES